MAKSRSRKADAKSQKPKAESKAQPAHTVDPESKPEPVARHIQPLGPRVLVRVVQSPDRLESGLFLPQGAKDEHAEALLCEVVEVARTMPSNVRFDDDSAEDSVASLGENVSGIPVGSKVLLSKERGIRIPWDETLRLVAVRYILAIVDEIPQAELQ